MTRIAATLAAVLLAVLAPAALAAPGFLPFQGVLTDLDGVPLEGEVDLHVALHPTATGGSPVWEELRVVDVEDGRFTVYLGEEVELDLDLFRDHVELYLGVAVGDDVEMERILLAAAAYAGFSQHCGDAATVGGLAATSFYGSEAELHTVLDDDYLPADFTPDWETIQNLPPGFQDGVDDVASFEFGEGFVEDGGLVSLAAATDETLGGVKAGFCPPGELVEGIAPGGDLSCAPDRTACDQDPPVPSGPFGVAEVLNSAPIGEPRSLTARENYLFWISGYGSEQGVVARMSKSGGTPTNLAENQMKPRFLAVDDEHAWWSNEGSSNDKGSLHRVPIDGGDVEDLASNVAGAAGVAIDETTVYFGADDGIRAVAKEGGPVKIVPGATFDAYGLAVHGDDIVFRGGQGVKRVPKTGGVPESLFSPCAGTGIAVGEGVAVVDCNFGIVRIPLEGGFPSIIQRLGDVGPYITVFGNHAVWADYLRLLLAARIDEPCPTMILSATPTSIATSIAADADYIYWGTAAIDKPTIFRMPNPL